MATASCLQKQVLPFTVRLVLAILISLALASIKTTNASADIGPKPSMDFTFVQEIDPPVTIIDGTLLECSDPACADGAALEELGPQGFSCTATECSSMAYGYAEYHQLVIRFSDGIERRSNVFTHERSYANYTVTIGEAELKVKEERGGAGPLVGLVLAVLSGAGLVLLMATTLILIVMLAVKAHQAPLSFAEARGAHIAAWVLSGLAGAIGGLFAPSLPLTLLIEGALAAGYARLRKWPIATVVTVVLLASLLTQPLLQLALSFTGGNGWTPHLTWILILESAIWLVEAGVLALTLRRTANLLECLGLSFVLNAVSFGIGWLLPL